MSDFFISPLFIILIVIAVIIAAVFIIKAWLNNKMRKVAGMSMGELAGLISQGMKEESTVPKGIHDLSAAYAPAINRDFPEVGYATMAAMAQNVLISYLEAIESGSTSKLDKQKCASSLFKKAENKIIDLNSKNEKEKYDNIDVHKCAISSYNNRQNEATAVFEISVGYDYTLIKGDKNSTPEKVQAAYKMILTYNQYGHEQANETVYTSTCPNCGAPVDMRTGICKYCNSSFTIIADRLWQVTDIDRIG